MDTHNEYITAIHNHVHHPTRHSVAIFIKSRGAAEIHLDLTERRSPRVSILIDRPCLVAQQERGNDETIAPFFVLLPE